MSRRLGERGPHRSAGRAGTGIWTDALLAAVSSAALVVVVGMAFAQPAGAGRAALSGSSIGKVTQRVRDVRRRGEGTLVWNAAATQELVYPRDVIYVGSDSSAVVTLDDGSQIDIDQASLIVIGQGHPEASETVAPIEVEVVRGAATGKAGVRRLALMSGWVAARLTSGAAAGIRVQEGVDTQVAAKRGKATLATSSGVVTLVEGETRRVSGDGKSSTAMPTAEIRLFSPVNDARFLSREADARLELMWESAVGRGPYVVLIGKDMAFTMIVERRKVDRPGVTVKGLPEGVYYWRVERSTKGRILSSDIRRVVVVRDDPPSIFRPRQDAVVDLSDRPVLPLGWSEISGVVGYRVELARGQSFNTPLYAMQTTTPSLVLRADEMKLEEGRHCVRVRVDDPGRPDAGWSPVVCFRLVTRPVLRAPELYDPTHEKEGPKGPGKLPEHGLLYWLIGSVAHAAEPGGKAVVLRWERLAGAVSYLVEVAADREFASVVVREKANDNYYRFVPPARQAYFWRVRGVDKDGREGKLSAVRLVANDVAGPDPVEPERGTKVEFGNTAPVVRLTWEPTELATDYEVELAATADFTGSERLESSSTSVEYRPQRVGSFHWRVVAKLPNEERSQPGPTASFVVTPAPPAPMTPKNDEKVPGAGVETEVKLLWTKRPVERYEVEVARDEGFLQRVKQLRVAQVSAVLMLEGVGRRSWRVRTTEPMASGWGPVGSFVILPATPTLTAPAAESVVTLDAAPGSIDLQWQAVPGAARYDVELQSADMTRAPVRQSLAGTTARVEVATPGAYFWSVKAILEAGLESRPSPAWRLDVRLREAVTATGLPSVEAPGKKPKVDVPVPGMGASLDHLTVGPSVGFITNLGEVSTVRVNGEVAFLRSLTAFEIGGMFRAGYYTESQKLADATTGIRVRSRIHTVPLELVGLVVLPTAVLDLMGGIGLSMNVTYGTLAVTGQASTARGLVDWGGILVAGAGRALGPGELVGEVSYGLSSRSRGQIETAPGGLQVAVGYRWLVW
jgi:hypothetical protein